MESLLIAAAIIIVILIALYACHARIKKLMKKQLIMIRQNHDYLFKILIKLEKNFIKPVEDFVSGDVKRPWVVVTSYNRPHLLQTTVESIRQHEPDVSVLVVDNGSNRETVNQVFELKQQGLVDKVVLNTYDDVPHWQKSFSLCQAFKLLTLEGVSSITVADDDILVKQSWLKDAHKLCRWSDVRLVCLHHDKIQSRSHVTERVEMFEGEEVHIKNSFNGAFFYVEPEALKALGYPPVGEGISMAGMEDWYFSRQLKARNWKVATINRAVHLGYDVSIRERLEAENEAF